MGLVHEIAVPSTIKEVTEDILDKICVNGPMAVRATKMLINNLRDTKDIKTMTTKLIAQLRVSDEGQEGLSSFFEKRESSWSRREGN